MRIRDAHLAAPNTACCKQFEETEFASYAECYGALCNCPHSYQAPLPQTHTSKPYPLNSTRLATFSHPHALSYCPQNGRAPYSTGSSGTLSAAARTDDIYTQYVGTAHTAMSWQQEKYALTIVDITHTPQRPSRMPQSSTQL